MKNVKEFPDPKDFKFIEDHIKNAPENVADKLKQIRKLLQKNVPAGVEGLSYAMPTIFYHGKAVACYYAWKNHIGFYPMGSMTAFDKEIKTLNLTKSKGAIQLPFDQPLPEELLIKIIKARLKMIG